MAQQVDIFNLTDLQADLGITDNEAVFTDVQLERLFERSNSNHDKTVYMAFRQILASSSLFYDYKSGMTEEKRSQARAHIKDMMLLFKSEGDDGDQFSTVGMEQIPDKKKDKPWKNRQQDSYWNSDEWDGKA